jgi:acyl-CoA synthetase (AMP-forming)/AMP-acid ligase II
VNLAETLVIPAELMPDAPAVSDGEATWSYGELAARAAGLAQALADRGLGPGSTVATMQGLSPEFVALLYGTLAAGATIAPLNARAKADELAVLVDAMDPDMLVVDERYADLAVEATGSGEETSVPVLVPADLGAAAATLEPVDVDPAATAILLHTSGTTGRPKPVPLLHEGLMSTLLRLAAPPDGTPRGATVLAAPNHHVAGLSGLLNSVFSGRRVELLASFEATAWLDRVEGSGADHAFVVPTMLRRILDEPSFDSRDLGTLGVLAYGAAPMPQPLIAEALRRFPPTTGFIASYGQTETGGTVCVLGVEDHAAARVGKEGAVARLASIGRPLPGAELTILGEDGEPLGSESPGEIAVRFEADEPWRRTGDLGRIDADGYVHLSSRADDLIIRGGENIDPVEIEAALGTHPAVAEVAVVGLPDEEWGERVGAFVVLRAKSEAGYEDLVAHSKASLASFKAPSEVHFVEELPRTALGKLKRRDLVAGLGQS